MTPERFARAVQLAGANPGSRLTLAVRRVLVDGWSRTAASAALGVREQSLSRAIQRISTADHLTHCPTCRQPV